MKQQGIQVKGDLLTYPHTSQQKPKQCTESIPNLKAAQA
jgi:hypothetical protein